MWGKNTYHKDQNLPIDLSGPIIQNKTSFDPNQFTLTELIGIGSFAKVYKAIYRNSNEFFGLKIHQ